jgi:hypothetical protein
MSQLSLRGAKKIPSLCSEQAAQSHSIDCHCERLKGAWQSDEVIARREAPWQSLPFKGLLRPFGARNDNKNYQPFKITHRLKSPVF